jgi:dTMP kinase
MEKGALITFEGGEGSGKSTQIRKLYHLLDSLGKETLVTREPGGTSIGEQVRSILLSVENTDLYPIAELFLYEAARNQISEQIIIPAIESGKIVLMDRFYDSTEAYQGFARGLDTGIIRELNRIVTKGYAPNLTILLDIDPEDGVRRSCAQGDVTRFEHEALEFHHRVRAGFLSIAAREPDRVKIVPVGALSEDEVFESVLAVIRRAGVFKWM